MLTPWLAEVARSPLPIVDMLAPDEANLLAHLLEPLPAPISPTLPPA